MKYRSVFLEYSILGIVLVLFFAMNQALPKVEDDDSYSYNLDIDGYYAPHCADLSRPIESISDIVKSQMLHYYVDNGRTPVHVLVQCFCGIWGKNVFNYCNTFVFLVFIMLLCKVTICKEGLFPLISSGRILRFIVPISIAFLLLSEPKAFYNGISHSINYLWSSVICMLSLHFFSKAHPHPILGVIYVAVAFLAGWSHETLAIGICGSLCILSILNRVKISKWQLSYLLAMCSGVILLVCSPGNFIRAGLGASAIWMRPLKFGFYAWPSILCLILSLLILWRVSSIKMRSFFRENQFWFIALAIATAFVFVSGAITKRSLYGVELFSIILAINSFNTIGWGNKKWISGISAFILVGIMLVSYPYQKAAGRHIVQINKVAESAVIDKLEKDENEHGAPILKLYIPRAELEAPWFLDKYICRFKTDAESWRSDDRSNTAFNEWSICWKNNLLTDEDIKFCYRD